MQSVDWLQPFRKIDRTTVVQVDLSPHTEHERAALTWLNAEEMARWRGYLHLGARYAFAMCRAALRATICAQLACQNKHLAFVIEQHGKPFAMVQGKRVAVSFNVSHSGEYGLLAFAPAGRLGVDVESYAARRSIKELAASAKLFTAHEREALAQVDGDDKMRLCIRLWTIKEALAKANGAGVGIGFASLKVPQDLLPGTTGSFQFADEPATPAKPAVHWRVDDIGNADFAAAVAQELV